MEKITSISFDYGNTLIAFGPDQVRYMYGELVDTLETMFGPCNQEHLKELRDKQIVRPYSNNYVENKLADTSEELISQLYGVTANADQIEQLIEAIYQSFVHVVGLSNGLHGILKSLKQNYRLALISNYPCSRAIGSSLEKIGLKELFDEIVVSGDIGYVKPHSLPFETVLNALNISETECIHVGDNWLADIQGAKRLGIKAVLTTEYEPYEHFKPNAGDHQPDYTIHSIDELPGLFRNQGK